MMDRTAAMSWCNRLASPFLHPPAGSVAIIAAPEDFVLEARGLIDAEHPSPPDGNTLFEIGSITKVFTSLLLAVLSLRGQIDADAPIASIVPDLAGAPHWITPRALATHSAGLPSVPWEVVRERLLKGMRNPYANFSEQNLIEWVGRYRPRRPPRPARFRYSNLGVGLLGFVLGRVHGAGYETALIEEVLQPLGLHDTRIQLSEVLAARLATPHYGSGKPTPPWDLRALCAAGALRSTASDMARFGLAVVNATQGAGLLQAAIRKTLEPQYQIKKKTGMCLGWVSQQEKSTNPPIYWHAGGTRGSASLLAVCPQAQFAAAMLANYGSFASLWGNIRVARANFNAIFREIASARMPGA